MPQSPVIEKMDLITFDLLIDGKAIEDKYKVTEIEIVQQINKIAFAEFTVLDGDPSDVEFSVINENAFAPGKEIQINLGHHSNNETVFKGVIVKTGIKVSHTEHSQARVYCMDKAIAMTAFKNNTYFIKQKDSDIISTLVSNHSLQKDVSITSYKHPEIIQYQATDWDFMMARAEANGLIVVTDNGKVCAQKPTVSGGPVISLVYGTDIMSIDMAVDTRQQLKAVTAKSWDFSTQKMIEGKSSEPSVNEQGNIKGKKLAETYCKQDYEVNVSGPVVKDELKSWANAKLLRARLARIQGTVTFMGSEKVKPNTLIKLEGVSDYFNGKAYVTGVEHVVREGSWITTATVGLDSKFLTDSAANVTTPIAGGLVPGIQGVYTGTVKKIHDDPDGETRIQVEIPVITSSSNGVWARLSTPYATNNAGTFFIPEIGDEVILGFLSGDPRYPVILGSVYSKKHKPPYTPGEKNPIKAIVTNNQLKIIFEDEKKNIIIETPSKNRITISDENKKILIEDQNKNKIEMSSGGIVIDTPKDIKLTAKGNILLDAKQKITLKATMDLAGEGMNAKFKGKMMASLEGLNTEVKGSAMTTVKGALVKIN